MLSDQVLTLWLRAGELTKTEVQDLIVIASDALAGGSLRLAAYTRLNNLCTRIPESPRADQ